MAIILILFTYVGKPILITGGNFASLGEPRMYKMEKAHCRHSPFCFQTVDACKAMSCFKLLGFLHVMTCSLSCECKVNSSLRTFIRVFYHSHRKRHRDNSFIVLLPFIVLDLAIPVQLLSEPPLPPPLATGSEVSPQRL